MFQPLNGEELEMVFDSFERKEHRKGDVLCEKGQPVNHLGILRMGEIASSNGEPLQESGGFAFYGVNGAGLQVILKPSILDSVPNVCWVADCFNAVAALPLPEFASILS